MLKKIFQSNALNLILISLVLIAPYFVFAQTGTITSVNTSTNPLERLRMVGSVHGDYSDTTNENTVFIALGIIINVVFSFLAIVFLAFITYSGYRWMMASGNQEVVTKSKAVLKQSIIGLAIVVGSWGIWQLVSTLWLNNL